MKKKSYFEKGDPVLAVVLIILVVMVSGVFLVLKNANWVGAGFMSV